MDRPLPPPTTALPDHAFDSSTFLASRQAGIIVESVDELVAKLRDEKGVI